MDRKELETSTPEYAWATTCCSSVTTCKAHRAALDLKLQSEINMDFLIELIDHFPIESGARAEIEERIEKTRAAIAKAGNGMWRINP